MRYINRHYLSIYLSIYLYQRMFVCDGLQHGRIRRTEKRKEFNCMQWYKAETTNNKRLRSTFCIEAVPKLVATFRWPCSGVNLGTILGCVIEYCFSV